MNCFVFIYALRRPFYTTTTLTLLPNPRTPHPTPPHPTPKPTGSTAIVVAAGGHHTCVVLNSGALKCWGANDRGQLGIGDTTDVSTPATVNLGSGAFKWPYELLFGIAYPLPALVQGVYIANRAPIRRRFESACGCCQR